MKKLILLLSVITLSFASIGKISAIRGDAIVISNGNQVKAELNQELKQNDVIKTEKNARLQIVFKDNTVTTLGRNTTLSINDYIIDGKNSKVNLEVNEGSFKVITGDISKMARENFSLKANTATIGIRGTVFVGEVGKKVNKLACLQGAIDVKVGNKTSLINSGKQISFEGAKVIKIETIKTSDFTMTSTSDNQSEDEAAATTATTEESKSNESTEEAKSNETKSEEQSSNAAVEASSVAIENKVVSENLEKEQERITEDKLDKIEDKIEESIKEEIKNPEEDIKNPDEVEIPDNAGNKPSGVINYEGKNAAAKVDYDRKTATMYKKSNKEMKKYESNEYLRKEVEIKESSNKVVVEKKYKQNSGFVSTDDKVNIKLDDYNFTATEDKLTSTDMNLSKGDNGNYNSYQEQYKDLEKSFYSDKYYIGNLGGDKEALYYYDSTNLSGVKVDIAKEYIGAYGLTSDQKRLIMSVDKEGVIRANYEGGAKNSEYIDESTYTSAKDYYELKNKSKNMELNFKDKKGSYGELDMNFKGDRVKADHLLNSKDHKNEIDKILWDSTR